MPRRFPRCRRQPSFNRDGGAKVYALDTPFLDAAVLDVDDLAHTYGMFVFADRTADYLHVAAFALEFIIELLVGHVMRFRRDFQGGEIDVEVNTALDSILVPSASCITSRK